MSDPAGSLDIQLRRSPEGLVCNISSTRPTRAARAFVGRSPDETASRLPLLFSICARAQAGACVKALEQAMRRMPSARAQIRREAAIAAETIREHLWRMLLDWPALIGEPPMRDDMAAVLALSNRILTHLDPSGELFRPGVETSAAVSPRLHVLVGDLRDLLTRQLFRMPPEVWLIEITDADAFEHWCRQGDTPASRLLRSLLDAGEASLGRTSVAALPEIPDAELITRLSGSDSADFISRPTWHGQPCETSPFTRALATPLIDALIESHGRGLLPRLAAQLLDVAMHMQLLTLDMDTTRCVQDPPLHSAEGVGLGRSGAARGLLVHLVHVENDRVGDYRILAPTEWNFHPQGVVAEGLAALPIGSETAVRRQAALLITAIDPCVGFSITLS
jgi:uptake hydrogenase large subunit